MKPPFSTAEFLDVFARYNQAVWPAQPLFYLLAALVLWLAWRPRARSGPVIAGVLAFFWAWMGVVYHWGFFRPINPAAALFAALFVLQAVLLLHAGMMRPRLAFRPGRGPASFAGAVLVVYALIVYPLLGVAFGEAYPRTPTFGLPCPTTIFTLGMLLWVEPGTPIRLIVIPVAWSLLGAMAAYQHGIVQDYGLLAAGIVTAALVLAQRRPTRVAGGAASLSRA